ncbi:hypothetical protein RintRC_0552 [Richelia intracellularis]|nr:hypothetical protein RintRC_0552 [Richelia intracellularis]
MQPNYLRVSCYIINLQILKLLRMVNTGDVVKLVRILNLP